MPIIGMECRKCTYFKKIKNAMRGGTVIVGFCELRQKHISDETVSLEQCKDRAVIAAKIEEGPKAEENEDEFIKRAAFGG